MNIVITGSLGNISKPLTAELVQKGHAVAVISSNPEKQKEIEGLGAKASIGKLEDLDFLISAFKGADAVYCMFPFSFTEADQTAYFQKIVSNYTQAIKQNKVEKVILLSGWAVDFIGSNYINDIKNQLADRTVIELRPGSFYTNFIGNIKMIKQYGMIMAAYGEDDKIAFVSPNDIAAVTAEEITTAFRGKKIRYVASEELTCNEAAGILGEAIGLPDLKWVIIPEEQIVNGLIQAGIPKQLAEDLVKMQMVTHRGIVFENYLKNRPVLGKTKLKDYAKEFAEAYLQK